MIRGINTRSKGNHGYRHEEGSGSLGSGIREWGYIFYREQGS